MHIYPMDYTHNMLLFWIKQTMANKTYNIDIRFNKNPELITNVIGDIFKTVLNNKRININVDSIYTTFTILLIKVQD